MSRECQIHRKIPVNRVKIHIIPAPLEKTSEEVVCSVKSCLNSTPIMLCSCFQSPHIGGLLLHSLSLIEPGPVHTEFEAKMMQDVRQKEYPGTDPETMHYFKNVYLPSAIDIFEMFGQTPDDIARVSPPRPS